MFLTGCTQAEPTAQAPDQPEIDLDVNSLPKPTATKTTVVGQVYDSISQQPIPNVPVRLAEVYRQGGEGAYVLDTANSPGAYADEKGVFIMQDIPAGEYVLVVGDVMGIYKVIPDEGNHPKVWDARAGQILNTGLHSVDLTQAP